MIKQIIPLFLILTLTLSCKKDGNPTPTNSNIVHQYDFGKNTLIGYIRSYDYIYPDSNVNAGIKVSVFGGNKVIDSTVTDSIGRFQFDSLEVGTYDLVASRVGWATFTKKSVVNSPGPNPSFMQYPYPVHKLVRKIYSRIDSVVLDSINGWDACYSVYVTRDMRDNLDSIKVNVSYPSSDLRYYYTSYYGNVIDVIGDNKIYFRTGWNAYHSGKTVLCYFTLSGFDGGYVGEVMFPYDIPVWEVRDGFIKKGCLITFP
jgi:hypothetical protein